MAIRPEDIVPRSPALNQSDRERLVALQRDIDRWLQEQTWRWRAEVFYRFVTSLSDPLRRHLETKYQDAGWEKVAYDVDKDGPFFTLTMPGWKPPTTGERS